MTKRTRYFMAGAGAVMLVGLGTGLFAYYSGGFPALSASRTGPSELSYVPADAAIVAYANVREVMDSQFRQRLKQTLPQEPGQKEFEEQTGIDVEKDINYVVAAMTGAGTPQTSGLVIANGNFNPTQLETFARQHGGEVEDYRGKRLITATTANIHRELHETHPEFPAKPDAVEASAVSLAFLEAGLVAIGSESAIKSAIDAQLTPGHSITSNSDMMELVSDIDRGNNAWAVGRLDAINQSRIPSEIRSHMPPVKTFAVMAHIDGGVTGTLRADASDDQSAENLRQIVNGFLAFGRMQTHNDPKAAAMLQSLQLSGSGKTVALSFAVPVELLDMIPHVKKQ